VGLASVLRGLAARWWFILAFALLGGFVAYTLVVDSNEGIEPQFRAEAVVFITNPEDDSRDVDEILTEDHTVALEIANSVNATALRDQTNRISGTPADGALTFVSMGRTAEEAATEAEEMRAAYVAADPRFGTETQLEQNFAEAAVLERRLDDLTPSTTLPDTAPSEATADRAAQIAILEARVGAIQSEVNTIAAQLLDTTDSEEIAQLETRLVELQGSLTTLYIELQPLQGDEVQAEEEPSVPITDTWTIQAIENRLAELQVESARVIIDEINSSVLELADADVIDETASEQSLPIWLLSGLTAGALLAAALVIIRDRSRRTIWHSRDLVGIPVIAEGPRERESVLESSQTLRRLRRQAIQTIRSAIVSSLSDTEGSVVGFVGPQTTSSRALKDLSYEVSASMAGIGRSVLMVDVGFAALPGDDPAFEGGFGLTQLVGSVSDQDARIDERVTSVLDSASSMSPGLDILFADPDRVDPIDLLDGKPFKRLLERSIEVYDVVILVSPPDDIASATRITTSLQQQVIVATRGKTSLDEIEAEAILGSPSGLRLRGVVLLDRGFGPLRYAVSKVWPRGVGRWQQPSGVEATSAWASGVRALSTVWTWIRVKVSPPGVHAAKDRPAKAGGDTPGSANDEDRHGEEIMDNPNAATASRSDSEQQPLDPAADDSDSAVLERERVTLGGKPQSEETD
jgi:hypothetical protein